MSNPFDRVFKSSESETLFPQRVQTLRKLEIVSVVVGILATVIQHGLLRLTKPLVWELGSVVILSVTFSAASVALRYYWSRVRPTFIRENRSVVVLASLWLLGILAILLLGPLLPDWSGRPTGRGAAILSLAELLIVLHGLAGVVAFTGRAAAGGLNPSLLLVLTFVALVAIGTFLLMLPRARSTVPGPDEPFTDQLRVALFTATSASCVTGLTVVPTGGANAYWSRTGQTVILVLFQIGGLGIMTCGAFFAVAVGNQLQFRESAALRDLLESNTLGDVRRLLLAILAFTLLSELVGAVLLSGLFSNLPLRDQVFHSVFHSVSAFCNAGFSLTENSLVGLGTRWQVWGVMSALIIIGGMGFATLYNVALVIQSQFQKLSRPPLFNLPANRVRLTVMSKLVLLTTVVLLVTGALAYHVLEATGLDDGAAVGEQAANAWFQSVTFRTAGFQTVEHGELQPATKLHAIGLMFIGASPGSTGGGVKTVAFALAALALVSILRGRRHVEFMGRTIPDEQIKGAFAIISLGLFAVMNVTLLLVLFENQPDRFLDHMFEVTSAFATVGVSTGITPDLKPSSQLLITATMFLGRVGPLTLLMAMAGQQSEARYKFPEERVTLG